MHTPREFHGQAAAKHHHHVSKRSSLQRAEDEVLELNRTCAEVMTRNRLGDPKSCSLPNEMKLTADKLLSVLCLSC